MSNKKIEQIYKLVETTEKNLYKLKEMLKSLDAEDKRDAYRDVPGITGTFDGINLVSEDGKKLEVPLNYAAKSRLVFGDTLKLIEEDGKQVFKQIEKIERKKVEGVLTKKEGKWYIISDSGTFKISDIAADFQHAELNDEAIAFIPAGNLNTPYAALDKVNKKNLYVAPAASVTAVLPPVTKKVEAASAKKETSAAKPVNASKPAPTKVSRPLAPKTDNRPQISEIGSNSSTGKAKPRVAPRSAPKVENTKEFVESLGSVSATGSSTPPTVIKSLDEDDLR